MANNINDDTTKIKEFGKTEINKVLNKPIDIVSHISNHVFPFVGAIEGNISAGKSTFCNMIANKNIYGKKIHCQYELINEKLLIKFYEDQLKYAFPLQLNTMTRRMQDLDKIRLQYSGNNTVIMLDRSMLGDFVFALKHRLSGNMSRDEFDIYCEEIKLNNLNTIIEDQRINFVVYLHSTPSQCRINVNKRFNTADKDVKEDYLNHIDNLYFYLILFLCLNKIINIYVIDWRNFGDSHTKLKAIYNNIKLEDKKDMQLSYSVVSFYDEKTFNDDNNKKVILPFDSKDVLEPLVKSDVQGDGFWDIDSKFCNSHTQNWKNKLVEYLDNSYHVYLKYSDINNKTKTLLDLFYNIDILRSLNSPKGK